MSLTAYRKGATQHTDETREPTSDNAIASDDEDEHQISKGQQDSIPTSDESNLTKVLKADLKRTGNSGVMDTRTLRQNMIGSEFRNDNPDDNLDEDLRSQILRYRRIHRPDMRPGGSS